MLVLIETLVIIIMVIFMLKLILDRKDVMPSTEKLYQKEIERLKRDNGNLQGQLELADKYKEEYKKLCEETKNMQKKYKEEMETVTKIEKEYTEYLEELKRA